MEPNSISVTHFCQDCAVLVSEHFAVHQVAGPTGQCPHSLSAGSSKILGVGPHEYMRVPLSGSSLMYVMLGQDPAVHGHFTSTIMFIFFAVERERL